MYNHSWQIKLLNLESLYLCMFMCIYYFVSKLFNFSIVNQIALLGSIKFQFIYYVLDLDLTQGLTQGIEQQKYSVQTSLNIYRLHTFIKESRSSLLGSITLQFIYYLLDLDQGLTQGIEQQKNTVYKQV